MIQYKSFKYWILSTDPSSLMNSLSLINLAILICLVFFSKQLKQSPIRIPNRVRIIGARMNTWLMLFSSLSTTVLTPSAARFPSVRASMLPFGHELVTTTIVTCAVLLQSLNANTPLVYPLNEYEKRLMLSYAFRIFSFNVSNGPSSKLESELSG